MSNERILELVAHTIWICAETVTLDSDEAEEYEYLASELAQVLQDNLAGFDKMQFLNDCGMVVFATNAPHWNSAPSIKVSSRDWQSVETK